MRVEIARERLIELLITEEIFLRLEAGGVDNWDNYSESLRDGGEQTMREFRELLRQATDDEIQDRAH